MPRSLLRRLDSPWVLLVVVALLYWLFISLRLARSDADPSAFVTAGDHFCDPQRVPPNLRVQPNGDGYDGQFYYRLALDPFTSTQIGFGIRLDLPPYRQQRIVYPLIVWVLSLNRFTMVPALMILVNYLAVCVLAWIGAAYSQSRRQHALWGLVFPLYPGFLLTISRDTIEIVEVAFLLAGLLCLRRGNSLGAMLLLTLATLTKETALLVVVAALIVWLREAWQATEATTVKGRVLLVPLLGYLLWQLLLMYQWGQLPMHAGGANLGLPLLGVGALFWSTLSFATPSQRLWFAELVFFMIFAGLVGFSLRSSTATSYEKLAWLLYALLIAVLTRAVWVEDWAFLRVLSEFYVLGALIMISTAGQGKMLLFLGTVGLWVFLFVDILTMR
jgi:hypothetical protein